MERIPGFLTKWLKCDDSEYTREVSRLIFAGGINRLYRNGCKFDDVPILIGTKQGEGKSTFVRWLALRDEYFREVSEIEGQKGIEAIEGGWICEMSELLALTKTKEVEAVKSYMTKLVDTYRRPFDKRVTDHKRQCIFIGTTNKQQFLTDKTGNRRFYPVMVDRRLELFDGKEKPKSSNGRRQRQMTKMKPYADRKLQNQIQAMQNRAVEEDYREELIKDYLSRRAEVCILQLWWEALDNSEYSKPTKKDSNEISLIIQSTHEWERQEKAKRMGSYGVTKYYKKIADKSVTIGGVTTGNAEISNKHEVDGDNPFQV